MSRIFFYIFWKMVYVYVTHSVSRKYFQTYLLGKTKNVFVPWKTAVDYKAYFPSKNSTFTSSKRITHKKKKYTETQLAHFSPFLQNIFRRKKNKQNVQNYRTRHVRFHTRWQVDTIRVQGNPSTRHFTSKCHSVWKWRKKCVTVSYSRPDWGVARP